MTTNLGFIMLPITKLSRIEQYNLDILKGLFGFDKWISAEPQVRFFNTYPHILSEIEKEFISLFDNKKSLNLFSFISFGFEIKQRYRLDIKRILNDEYLSLNPFDEGYFETSSHSSMFYYLFGVKNNFSIKVPTFINNVEILLGSLQSADLINYDTLRSMNFDEIKWNIDFTDDGVFEGVEWTEDDVFEQLGIAKRKEFDFFVYYD